MKRLKHNWQWKLTSLLIGFFLWSYISAGVNPTQTVTFSDIPVEIINQEVLNRENYEVVEMNPAKVSASFTGKRNALGTVRPENLHAVVDARELGEGQQIVTARVKVPGDLILSKTMNTQISIKVEKIITRSVSVLVDDQGTVGDNFILESVTPTPQSVTITGARSKVNQVHHLRASIDVSGMSEDSSSNVKLTPVNQKGAEVDGVKMSISSANVSISVLKQKEVPVTVRLVGNAKEDTRLQQVQALPAKLLIKGKSRQIDAVTSLSTENVDRSTITGSEQRSVSLIFPEGIQPVEDVRKVKLDIRTETPEDKTFDLPLSQVEFKGLAEGLAAQWEKADTILKVTLHGFPTDLANVDAKALTATASLVGKDEGRQEAGVQIQAPEGISVGTVVPEAPIVLITKKQGESN